MHEVAIQVSATVVENKADELCKISASLYSSQWVHVSNEILSWLLIMFERSVKGIVRSIHNRDRKHEKMVVLSKHLSLLFEVPRHTLVPDFFNAPGGVSSLCLFETLEECAADRINSISIRVIHFEFDVNAGEGLHISSPDKNDSSCGCNDPGSML